MTISENRTAVPHYYNFCFWKLSLLYLVLDLLRCVCKENWCVRITSRHLGLCSLQCWEKWGMKKCWLMVAKSWGNIACHPKIWILQNQTNFTCIKVKSIAILLELLFTLPYIYSQWMNLVISHTIYLEDESTNPSS
jgi:hypothetical protein